MTDWPTSSTVPGRLQEATKPPEVGLTEASHSEAPGAPVVEKSTSPVGVTDGEAGVTLTLTVTVLSLP